MLQFLDDVLQFIWFIYDLFWHWRFNLCLAIGVALAVAAYTAIELEWFRAIAFVAIVAVSLFLGWRWDRAA